MLQINGYDVPEHTSYSSITTWLACGYQYFLTRIRKVEEKAAIWNLGGSAVHRATEVYDYKKWEIENA